MKMATTWVKENCNVTTSIMICTDSQSLCMAMEALNPETDPIKKDLINHRAKIVVQWIPGHSGTMGNEWADSAAKEATSLPEESRPITLRSAYTQINRSFEDDTRHQRVCEVYSHFNKEKEQTINNRKDQVTLARIRSGKHLAFNAYRNKIDKDVSPTCPRCQEAEHTLEHWFKECPGTLALRREFFGEDEGVGLGLLTDRPRESLALARRTLLGASRRR